MAADPAHFHESNLWSTPSRDVGLTIESTRLEPILGELDEDVADIEYSLDQYYGRATASAGELPRGLDGALKAIFEDLGGCSPGEFEDSTCRRYLCALQTLCSELSSESYLP